MNAFNPLFVTLVVLCLLCGHCNLAKPNSMLGTSMTRIQEVFRTLMAKPMMFASRGKKSLAAPSARGYLLDREGEENGRGKSSRRALSDSYWVMVPLNERH
ncbi:hypothetical protein ACQ4LE_006906 [Meloidogyne hapla]|uniref:Secreted protein n=1 Tax=Meloidogyne hapla TaxID=6305 RepID=A0A1I8BIP3_MELHA